MIKAAIDHIRSLQQPDNQVVPAPDFRVTGRYFVFDRDGNHQIDFAEKAPEDTVHYSTSSLAAAYAADHENMDMATAAIYYSRKGIKVAMQHGGPGEPIGETRWQHTMPLPHHPVFTAVTKLQDTAVFTQRELIRFLRAQLNGHVPEEVVTQFRELKLKNHSDGTSVMASGREGVDKSIQKEILVAGGRDIPSEIVVSVPVYDLDELRSSEQKVFLLIEAVASEDGQPLFEITAVLNSLRTAEAAALEEVVSNLQKALPAGTQLFHGSL